MSEATQIVEEMNKCNWVFYGQLADGREIRFMESGNVYIEDQPVDINGFRLDTPDGYYMGTKNDLDDFPVDNDHIMTDLSRRGAWTICICERTRNG